MGSKGSIMGLVKNGIGIDGIVLLIVVIVIGIVIDGLFLIILIICIWSFLISLVVIFSNCR